mgnify:CR=1 FL=1
MEQRKPRITERDVNQRLSTHLSEVILENFMSYEYARIPLRTGINIVSGPNGAGKSSILLAISVALGQVYTERSKRLSDLIRRGKDIARVTLIFDNNVRDSKRPIPFSRSDMFMLSRYLKRDGSYWFEADYKEISKAEVVELFSRLGVNPDNPLIIMHQGMVEEFAVTIPQQKLKMVEEAVGFQTYREDILSAKGKLHGVSIEEATLGQTLESAEHTLDYWKNVYERFLMKKTMVERKRQYEREHVWAQAIRWENSIKNLDEKHLAKEKQLTNISKKIERNQQGTETFQNKLGSKQTELRKLYFSLVRLEKDKARSETTASLLKDLLNQYARLRKEFQGLADSGKPPDELVYAEDQSRKRIDESDRLNHDLVNEIQGLQGELAKVDKEIDTGIEKLVNSRIEEAVLALRKKDLETDIRDLGRSLSDSRNQLEMLSSEIAGSGPRIETQRSPSEILEEIRVITGHLLTLGDIADDAEKIYTDYASTYEELKARLVQVSDNKNQALSELEGRSQVWQNSMEHLLEEVNPIYQGILSRVESTGLIRLVQSDDIEKAGLELLVGFRGSEATVLDAYSQSGGERSLATTAFLLALQQGVISPIRAVDEFDVHLDPRNREAVFRMIFESLQKSQRTEGQYILITPGQITVVDPKVNILLVQNAYGKSKTRKVESSG